MKDIFKALEYTEKLIEQKSLSASDSKELFSL